LKDSVQATALREIFVRALMLRIVAAIIIHLAFSEGMFAPDQYMYHRIASSLASFWSGETAFYHPKIDEPGPRAYFYITGILYYVFGQSPIVPKLLNSLVGALTVRVAFDVALGVTQNGAIALRTARFVAYFPSLILWSVLNIRDAWVILLIVLICREAIALQEAFRLKAVVTLAASVLALVQFRDYILFPVTLPVVISLLVRNRKHIVRNTVAGMLAASAIIYANQAASGGRPLRMLDLEQLHEMRQWHTVGADSSFERADISTPGKALLFLPKGLTLFLFAPFPWMIGSIRQVLAMPETLFFYSLVPSIVRGIRHLLAHRLAESLMVILLAGGMTFGYALGEGNAGTAYRHRAQMLPCYLLFAAVGREVARRRAIEPMMRVSAAPVLVRPR
jgi:hypothetical protein